MKDKSRDVPKSGLAFHSPSDRRLLPILWDGNYLEYTRLNIYLTIEMSLDLVEELFVTESLGPIRMEAQKAHAKISRK